MTSNGTRMGTRILGRFLDSGRSKLYVRGVTYGTFRPDADGHEYPEASIVERDFEGMAALGVNAVRTYTTPPRWLLDAASRHGLRVAVGLSIERHIGRLLEGGDPSELEDVIRREVEACAGHSAILFYILGNEIPSPIVRWLGPERFERLLRRLYETAKRADPETPVTYANYPSTEYLRLEFLDLLCFNVFLESQTDFDAYLAHLQNMAGDRPLVIGEMGLDSRRHGEAEQAKTLAWQVESAFAGGCAGTFVYAWTDEWHTGAGEIHDWDFGLVRRDRSSKPALDAVRSAYSQVPVPRHVERPRMSVIVCTYNGSRTLRDCLTGIGTLVYPDYETIVVDDGSTDDTAAIAREFPVRLISTPQSGLGNARNTGLEAATGEIVAYLDDDAWPDPHWLDYLAVGFAGSDHAAVGGPNIAPPGYGRTADCVARAPGNPTHVLLTDREAEHLPGCNMAFRRSSLQAIGGFDPRYRAAGDDVDIGWRLRERGMTMGFVSGAMVWHRRRSTVRAYLKQQRGYGRAEALLEAKWPRRYTGLGLAMWSGRVYANDRVAPVLAGTHVYYGVWGTAPFQSIYGPGTSLLGALPLLPEWYLLIIALGVLAVLGAFWAPLLVAVPFLLGAILASLVQAVRSARLTDVQARGAPPGERLRAGVVTAFLYALQPAARLRGRLEYGLTPWRRRRPVGSTLPRPGHIRFWSEHWQPPELWVRSIEEPLRELGVAVRSGGAYDRFDLEVPGGILGAVRLLVGVEEHGAGQQLVRIRYWPRWSWLAATVIMASVLLSVAAAANAAWPPAIVFAALAIVVLWRAVDDAGAATAEIGHAIEERVGRAAEALAPPGSAS